MPTPSNTPLPGRLGATSVNSRPRIKIHIPPPGQRIYFGATLAYLGTAHSNPSMQLTGAPPQWSSSPYVNPFVPIKDGMFKQSLNKVEKFLVFVYDKLSRWSRKWFTHIFLLTFVFLYTVAGAYIFIAVEGPAQENTTATYNNLKVNFSRELFKLAGKPECREVFQRWEEEATKEIYRLQVGLVKLYRFGKIDEERAQPPPQKAWSFWNAMYYCGTIYTTIGYGHISPATNTGRAITIVYAIFGIPIFLIFLADFGQLFTRAIKFVWAYVRRIHYTGSLRRVRKHAQVQEMIGGMNYAYEIANFRRLSMMMKESDMERAQTATPNSSHLAPTTNSETLTTPIPPEMAINDEFNLPISVALVVLITYILCGAFLYTLLEDWSFFESCYFIFVSMSTIGFGDFVPQYPGRMMVRIIYMIFGLALTSMCINVVQVKLSDSFRRASAKIGATIGLTLAEEEARISQNLTPVPEEDPPPILEKNADQIAPPVPSRTNRKKAFVDNTASY